MWALRDTIPAGTAPRVVPRPAPREAGRHERILALQRAAGNRATVAALAGRDTARTGGGVLVLQRGGTGLAGEKVSKKYAKTVRGGFDRWAGLSLNERMSMLLEPAIAALAAAGVPRAPGVIDPTRKMTGTAEHAAFNRGLWQVWFNPDFLTGPVTPEEFGRCANTAYHECRHAEQVFRVARKLAGEGKGADVIAAAIQIPLNIAKEAVTRPLKAKEKAEWAEAERWQLNIEVGHDGQSPADLVNARKDQALIDYHQARSMWRAWQKVFDNAPTADPQLRNYFDSELLKPGGAARMKQLTEGLQDRYVRTRELAKQAYLQYAKMPVEEDAWATGGMIERHLNLKPATAEAELDNLDLDERTMTPIAQPGLDNAQPDLGGPELDLSNLSAQEQILLAAMKKAFDG
ncbi:hypothetical protein AB0J86_12365 [Micromonospora sp. NPDC049559]|uniref:hypothetical protein n=1 Tax=Micromonospora sp. NPDC049559 TaxID=3155923 RepID=UPI00344033AD